MPRLLGVKAWHSCRCYCMELGGGEQLEDPTPTVLEPRSRRLHYTECSVDWACSSHETLLTRRFQPLLACLQGQQAPVVDTVGRCLIIACLDSTSIAAFIQNLHLATFSKVPETHAWVHCFVVSWVRQEEPSTGCVCVRFACSYFVG